MLAAWLRERVQAALEPLLLLFFFSYPSSSSSCSYPAPPLILLLIFSSSLTSSSISSSSSNLLPPTGRHHPARQPVHREGGKVRHPGIPTEARIPALRAARHRKGDFFGFCSDRLNLKHYLIGFLLYGPPGTGKVAFGREFCFVLPS